MKSSFFPCECWELNFFGINLSQMWGQRACWGFTLLPKVTDILAALKLSQDGIWQPLVYCKESYRIFTLQSSLSKCFTNLNSWFGRRIPRDPYGKAVFPPWKKNRWTGIRLRDQWWHLLKATKRSSIMLQSVDSFLSVYTEFLVSIVWANMEPLFMLAFSFVWWKNLERDTQLLSVSFQRNTFGACSSVHLLSFPFVVALPWLKLCSWSGDATELNTVTTARCHRPHRATSAFQQLSWASPASCCNVSFLRMWILLFFFFFRFLPFHLFL